MGLIQLVAGLVMGLSNGFQIGFDPPQVSHARLKRVDGMKPFGLHARQLALGIAPLEKPQLLLPQAKQVLQGMVALRHFGLLFQLVQVGVKFAQDVFHPGQVFTGVMQAIGCLAPALLVLGHTCGFFQKQAQFFGPGLDDAADRALTDDGVSARTQARAQEHVLHIAAAHRLVVDVIAAVAVACEHAFDGDLRKLAPLPARTVTGVVKHQFDTGPTGGFALRRPVEDDVLHGLATQLAGLAFAQHPTHGIHDVGLSAAVRPHHPDQLTWQVECGGLGKRLEAGQFDGVKAHARSKKWRTSDSMP